MVLRFLPPAQALEPPGVKAAAYMRMSTDMQTESISNQHEVIERYASQNGYRIVQTYADRALSGLSLKGRPALQALLSDIHAQPDFEAILVHDISRWGRFQDVDESAFYEFQCRLAGVRVIYCAEPFADDHSPMSAVYKTIKRVMAGEFSRELSAKVQIGHRKLAAKGYWQGGPAGYGLSRAVVAPSGALRGLLARGEERFSRTDRVILVPGDEREIATVRDIFRLYCEKRKTRADIARQMNADGVKTARGGKWFPSHVRIILTNSKYAGDMTYGRTTQILGNSVRPTPSEAWVRSPNAFEPIIDRAQFDLAQRIQLARSGEMTKAQMTVRLQVLLKRHGKLTRTIIESDPETPSATLYVKHFGDIVAAYRAVGWTPPMSVEAKLASAKVAAVRKREHRAAVLAANLAGAEPPVFVRKSRDRARGKT